MLVARWFKYSFPLYSSLEIYWSIEMIRLPKAQLWSCYYPALKSSMGPLAYRIKSKFQAYWNWSGANLLCKLTSHHFSLVKLNYSQTLPRLLNLLLSLPLLMSSLLTKQHILHISRFGSSAYPSRLPLISPWNFTSFLEHFKKPACNLLLCFLILLYPEDKKGAIHSSMCQICVRLWGCKVLMHTLYVTYPTL